MFNILTRRWAQLTVWPDLAIYWTLDNFLKSLATIDLPKSPTFLGFLVKVSKSIIFLVKSFLGNFDRHLAIFFWSHCQLNIRIFIMRKTSITNIWKTTQLAAFEPGSYDPKISTPDLWFSLFSKGTFITWFILASFSFILHKQSEWVSEAHSLT